MTAALSVCLSGREMGRGNECKLQHDRCVWTTANTASRFHAVSRTTCNSTMYVYGYAVAAVSASEAQIPLTSAWTNFFLYMHHGPSARLHSHHVHILPQKIIKKGRIEYTKSRNSEFFTEIQLRLWSARTPLENLQSSLNPLSGFGRATLYTTEREGKQQERWKEEERGLPSPGPKTPFFVSRRTSCYGRRTTCSVREDKLCPPSRSRIRLD